VSVNVLFELDADLTLGWLVFDERMLQQLLCTRPHGVVLDQAHLDKVVELLWPAQHKTTAHFPAECLQNN